MKGAILLKKQSIQVRCLFCGEEDVREIFLHSFRLYLGRSLAEGFGGAVQ